MSSAANPKAQNFSPSVIAENNQYTVGDLAGTQGTEYYPYFTASFNQWFTKISGETDFNNCPNIFRSKLTKEAIKTNMDFIQLGIGNIYGPEVLFDTELKLYRQLKELSLTEALTNQQQSMMNALASTAVGDFIAFENLLRKVVRFSTADSVRANTLNTDIQTITTAINDIVWFKFDELTEEIDIDKVAYEERQDKITRLKQTIDELSQLIQTYENNFLNNYAQLHSINDNINNNSPGSSPSLSAQNLKTINTLLLERLHPDFGGFSTNELQTIENMANQCAGHGGEAVFTARSLLTEIDLEIGTYDDECLQAQFSSPDITTQLNSSSGDFSIAPNPASHTLSVLIPTEWEVTELILTDISGKIIQIIPIHDRLKIFLNVEHLKTGIYFLSTKQHQENTLKLVITE